MSKAHTNKQSLNRVTVKFADGSRSSLSPRDATFEHIADRVDDLSARHERPAIAVAVRLATTPPQRSPPSLPATFRDGLLAELPRLRAFARSMAHNSDRADDLVQETLAKAWAHRSKFKEGTNLGAWSFTILRNTYLGELRSERREVADSDGHYAAKLGSPPAQLHYAELQDVARAFEGLTTGQRGALFLVGVSGLTYAEAARVGGCAVGTIKSRVCRARQILLRKWDGLETPGFPARGGRDGRIGRLEKRGRRAFRGATAPLVSQLPICGRLH